MEKVTIINSTDKRWLDFITEKSNSSIFHHPIWIDNLKQCYGYNPFVVTCFDEQDKICGGIPVMEVDGFLTGKRWISIPFTDYCEPLYEDISILMRLTAGIIELSRERNIPAIELRWEYPYRNEINYDEKYVYHVMPLSSERESLFHKVNKRTREYIKSSIKKGINISLDTSEEAMKKFYRLQLITRKRHGIPVQPWKYFYLLEKNIISQGMGFILLAHFDNQCIAGIVCLKWNKTIIVKYAASDLGNIGKINPNHLLWWKAAEWGCENGYTNIHGGRSDLSGKGLREFKDHLGYDEYLLKYSEVTGKKHTINKINDEKSFARRMMNQVISHSPLWVTKTMGELLYRHFP